VSRVAPSSGVMRAARRLFGRIVSLNSSLTASEQMTIALVLGVFILGCIVKYFLTKGQ